MDTPRDSGGCDRSDVGIRSLDELIAGIHATEGDGSMVLGTFGPAGFEGNSVHPKSLPDERKSQQQSP